MNIVREINEIIIQLKGSQLHDESMYGIYTRVHPWK